MPRVHCQGANTPFSNLISDRAHSRTIISGTQSTVVRGYTTKPLRGRSTGSRETIGKASSSLYSGTTSSTPLTISSEPTVVSIISVRHVTNGKDHLLINPDLCFQTQPIRVEFRSLNPRSMGHPDKIRGLPHSSLVPTPPSWQSSPVHSEQGNLVRSLLQRQAICHIPVQTRVHVHSTQEKWKSETCYQPETLQQICEIRVFQNQGVTQSNFSMASSKQMLMELVQLSQYLLGFIVNSKKYDVPIPRNRISGNVVELYDHWR